MRHEYGVYISRIMEMATFDAILFGSVQRGVFYSSTVLFVDEISRNLLYMRIISFKKSWRAYNTNYDLHNMLIITCIICKKKYRIRCERCKKRRNVKFHLKHWLHARINTRKTAQPWLSIIPFTWLHFIVGTFSHVNSKNVNGNKIMLQKSQHKSWISVSLVCSLRSR